MDITVVRVDVDSEFVERALRAVPGVAPAGDGEERTAEERDRDGERGPGERSGAEDQRGDGRADEERVEGPDERRGEAARPPGGERSTERVGETPPPAETSVPTREENGESGGRNWRRTLLAAGAALTGVGALVGLAALLWRRRGASDGAEEEATEPASESRAERERPDRTVDRAPLVGLCFLVATAFVQRLLARQREESEGGAVERTASSQPRP